MESLPSILFNRTDDEVIGLMEGSSLWLYCNVNSSSSNVVVKWTKNGRELMLNLPHIYTATYRSFTYTTSLLVIEDIVLDDVGVYQCSVRYPQGLLYGNILTFQGIRFFYTALPMNCIPVG